LTPLPIDERLPEIRQALAKAPNLVLQAAPGAGKTTRVPRALLLEGLAGGKEVVVLEPRRLATRLSAARVAEELGEPLGERVGYQVRFEDVGGPKTRLRFVTEGILTRRLLSEPTLPSVGAVILDEFHERHLASDLALALLRRLQQTSRPDLKLVVMSATLEAAPLATFLGDCPTLSSEGRRFPVDVQYLPAPDERHLDQQVLGALKRLVAGPEAQGHVLVFLPGAGEIRRSQEACADFAQRHGYSVHLLHGDLPAAEQDRAVRPSSGKKLILSTNVAETSVTIEGVTAVIDSGLARVASFSPWTGLPALKVAKVSKSSATQRAGRAGRTQAGRCVRLYTQADFDGRVEHEAPEIRRQDLAETLLALHAMGVRDVARFPFFEAPPTSAVESAELLLHRLGAVDAQGELTTLGKRLLSLPLHPRLARVVAEGERRGVPQEAALAAALLGERDVRLETRTHFAKGRGPSSGGRASSSGPSDVLDMMERVNASRGSGRAAGLDDQAVRSVDRARKQISRGLRAQAPAPASAHARDEAVLLSLLAGFPDRVAKRRRPHAPELVLFGGGTATLAETSVVQEPELLLALDAEERGHGKGSGKVVVRLASEVQPEWLLDLGDALLESSDALAWNPEAERVERVARLAYGNLVLEETSTPPPPSEETAKLLAEAALAAGLSRFLDEAELDNFLNRVQVAAQASPGAGLPVLTRSDLGPVLTRACQGLKSFAELKEAQPLSLLRASLTSGQQRALSEGAPDRVTLPGGRSVQVHYEVGKPPWVESRLQDFFGMRDGPKLGVARVPLVLHLLAPNHRAVQVTTDLAGFWDRHYPAVRKELMRKYPRHSWPEDPRTAAPPVPGPRRFGGRG
jgi:ATP-dependent helicase HrpB